MRLWMMRDHNQGIIAQMVVPDDSQPDWPPWVVHGQLHSGWYTEDIPLSSGVSGPDWREAAQRLYQALRSGEEDAAEAAQEFYRDTVRAQTDMDQRLGLTPVRMDVDG